MNLPIDGNIKDTHLNTLLRKMALACAVAAGLGQAHAGVLTFQDVVFTTSWANNVLTLEIDAAKHSGDWSRATTLGALSLKDIGSFRSVSLTAAPQGADAWRMTAKELNANGCTGGAASRSNKALCLSGAPIALTDNMVFSFTFTGGTPDLDQPHLKVNFLDASQDKVGNLLSQAIAAAPAAATPAGTPVPVTPTPVPTTPLLPTEPATSPATGNTTVPTPDDKVAMAPAIDAGTPSPVPVPPPLLVTPPVVELEPVSAGSPGSVSNEVPEPQSIALLLGGLALMGMALRKRS